MRKILIGIIILLLLMWSPQSRNTQITTITKDTVQVYSVTTNMFHIIVPSLINGHGFGKNIPNITTIDTSYFIKYPNNINYKPINKDSLRLKLNNLAL